MEVQDEINAMFDTGSVDAIGAGADVSAGGDTGDANPTPIPTQTPDAVALDELRKQFADDNTKVSDITEENPLDKFKEDVEFMKKEDFDALADNPALLNVAMNSVRRQTAEALINAFPGLINKAIALHQQKQDIHNTFYGKYPELVSYKKFVATIATDVAEKMKDKTPEEIFTEIAKSAKEKLKLPNIAVSASAPGVKPALRNASGGARSSSGSAAGSKTDAQTQIADMLSVS